ncbi:TPA: DUF551 domain-containing protein [Escherichia coli]|nr:DUF551 domain-containing protein [Escherichia coli]EFJ5376566.1 DUF551 domain-containing protein [Escherichia coli]HAI8266961.1 DUF551 domain-containing protein [Escherichia coli]HAI8358438.1 DUF551 domain-containing protein [Escherichia coli]HAI8515224.1 DUF551 domain-containing protein [Escherichia coli]
MSAITKERIKLFIKNPLDNGLTSGEQMELARIALASLEAEPVAWLHSDNGLGIPAITRSKNIADSWLSKGWYVQPLYIAKPVPVVPDARPSLNNGIVGFDEGWNACRAAMLQGSQPVSQTYKFPVNTPCQDAPAHIWLQTAGVWPEDGELSELTWCSHNQHHDDTLYVRADLVNGNSPVTPDGWISCSERMPNDAQWCVVNTEYGYYVQCWSEGQGWLGDDISIPECDVINWMPLPEPPQEVK